MAKKAIPGSEVLAKKIKTRRNELGLTIEEAASRAGVGTKTWSRYEAGESIRQDKCKGICRALNWRNFPEESEHRSSGLAEDFKEHEAWSPFLADMYGPEAAVSFAAGSDILLDYIEQDLTDLAAMPCGSHIGQLRSSFLKDELPAQYLMQYNYDVLYQMKCVLIQLRTAAKSGSPIIAHTVMEELLLYLCSEQAYVMIELNDEEFTFDEDDYEDFREWVFALFDDMDIITFLYSDICLDRDHPYAFSHWNEQQFYTDLNHQP